MLAVLISFFGIILGLGLLTIGADRLVIGAVVFAKKFHLSEAIIGLTIVAIGTSMPELIVSLTASMEWKSDIAIWNVLGSNISNILLILGITACISTMTLAKSMRKFDIPVIIVVTLLLALMASDRLSDGAWADIIGRTDGVILLGWAILFILYSFYNNNEPVEDLEIDTKGTHLALASLYVILGIWLLFWGGKILIYFAVDLARIAGLSEAIIGLTIVAIGTSMPELVTSMLSALRWKSDLAIGNIVGSNIMNILLILGVSAVIAPISFSQGSYIDLWVSIGAALALLLVAFLWKRNKIGRKEGVILLSLYLFYIGYLIVREIT